MKKIEVFGLQTIPKIKQGDNLAEIVYACAEQEIAGSANPLIRQFKISRTAADAPARDCKGEWVLADPATSAEFTAVGYYFAKRLQSDLGAPVGIINATWGGTFSEAWAEPATRNARSNYSGGF